MTIKANVVAVCATLLIFGASACGIAQTRALPGALTKPIGQYTPAELIAFAHRLRYVGGNERSRHCREADCAAPTAARSTSTRVDAVDGEDSVSAAVIPANGVIVARARNRGLRTERMYSMQSGNRYEYYLIVLPGVRGAARWLLEEVDVTPNAQSHRSVATGAFTECHHRFARGARADFKTCAQAAALHQAAFSKMPMQGGIDPPIWVACASGCCTADPDGIGGGNH